MSDLINKTQYHLSDEVKRKKWLSVNVDTQRGTENSSMKRKSDLICVSRHKTACTDYSQLISWGCTVVK